MPPFGNQAADLYNPADAGQHWTEMKRGSDLSVLGTMWGPSRQQVPFFTGESRPRAYETLMNFYTGKNVFLGNVIDMKMRRANTWHFYVCPIEYTDDISDRTYTTIQFGNDVYNPRSDYSAVSNISYRRKTESFGFTAVGQGIEGELKSLLTMGGQQLQVLFLQQLANNLVTTFVVEVHRAFNVKSHRLYGNEVATGRTTPTLAELARSISDMFLVIDRTGSGLETLAGFVFQLQTIRNAQLPDMVVVPFGTSEIRSSMPANRIAAFVGDTRAERVRLEGSRAFATVGGAKNIPVIEEEPLSINNREVNGSPHWDPMTRRVQTGRWYTMDEGDGGSRDADGGVDFARFRKLGYLCFNGAIFQDTVTIQQAIEGDVNFKNGRLRNHQLSDMAQNYEQYHRSSQVKVRADPENNVQLVHPHLYQDTVNRTMHISQLFGWQEFFYQNMEYVGRFAKNAGVKVRSIFGDRATERLGVIESAIDDVEKAGSVSLSRGSAAEAFNRAIIDARPEADKEHGTPTAYGTDPLPFMDEEGRVGGVRIRDAVPPTCGNTSWLFYLGSLWNDSDPIAENWLNRDTSESKKRRTTWKRLYHAGLYIKDVMGEMRRVFDGEHEHTRNPILSSDACPTYQQTWDENTNQLLAFSQLVLSNFVPNLGWRVDDAEAPGEEEAGEAAALVWDESFGDGETGARQWLTAIVGLFSNIEAAGRGQLHPRARKDETGPVQSVMMDARDGFVQVRSKMRGSLASSYGASFPVMVKALFSDLFEKTRDNGALTRTDANIVVRFLNSFYNFFSSGDDVENLAREARVPRPMRGPEDRDITTDGAGFYKLRTCATPSSLVKEPDGEGRLTGNLTLCDMASNAYVNKWDYPDKVRELFNGVLKANAFAEEYDYVINDRSLLIGNISGRCTGDSYERPPGLTSAPYGGRFTSTLDYMGLGNVHMSLGRPTSSAFNAMQVGNVPAGESASFEFLRRASERNPNFYARWKYLDQNRMNRVQRAAGRLFLFTQISGDKLLQFANAGYPVPENYLLMDPFVELITGKAIFARAGSGALFMSKSTFNVQKDEVHLAFQYSVSMNIGAVIYDQDSNVTMDSAKAIDYVGGGDGVIVRNFATPGETYNHISQTGWNFQCPDERAGNRFVIGIGPSIGRKDMPDPLPASGIFNPALFPGSAFNGHNVDVTEYPAYPSWLMFNLVTGFNMMPRAPLCAAGKTDTYEKLQSGTVYNELCFSNICWACTSADSEYPTHRITPGTGPLALIREGHMGVLTKKGGTLISPMESYYGNHSAVQVPRLQG